MFADMISNKKLNQTVTEIFIRGKKLNISTVFIKQSYFAGPQNVTLNCTYIFIIKIQNKQKLQQIKFDRSSDIVFKDFMNLYKKCNAKPHSFLVINTTIASDNPLCFKKNLLDRI